MLNFTEHSMLHIAHAIYINSVQFYFILSFDGSHIDRIYKLQNGFTASYVVPSRFLETLTQNKLHFNNNPRCIDIFQTEKTSFKKVMKHSSIA